MSGIFASCVMTALLLVVTCAVTCAEHHHHHQQGDMNDHHLSSPNTDFAFALYKNLEAKAAPGDNTFYSPLGISTALSMLSTGARGETHSQLFSSLGYSNLSQTQVNEAYEHLFRMHGHTNENQQLDVGNAVALSSDFSPQEKFLNDVRHYYFGEILNVDFSKPGEAAAEINTYIANKTQNKIKHMVKNLDRETAMVLINYVYFRGQWKYPFEKELTHKADFHVNGTIKVEVDMMSRTGSYKTYLDPNRHTTVIMLPYEGNTSMMIVLPDEGKMKEVEGYINKNSIRLWRNSATEKYVRLHLPKFAISSDASLDTTLKEMGITNAFENIADFRGISDKAKIKVSKASHKATLSITEMGTEAAATSIFELMFYSLPQSVTINRPFLVFILENPTESILFMGKINNPMLI